MPDLPLSVDDQLGSGDLPVRDRDDVKAILPAKYKEQVTAPVRDALVDGSTGAHRTWQDRATIAAAKADVSRSQDELLDGLGADRDITRAKDEPNPAYRRRIFELPLLVSPTNIVDEVNKILAPFTDIEAQLFESVLDRWYASRRASNAVWHSFVGRRGQKNPGPNYGSRLLAGDAPQNNGQFRPNTNPGNAWAFNDQAGRYFILRVPDLVGLGVFAPARGPIGSQDPSISWYVGDGTSAINTSYLSASASTALSVYEAIVDRVQSMVGQSIRWKLVADPELT